MYQLKAPEHDIIPSILFSYFFLATHNAFSGDDATQLEICPDESHSDGDLRDADAVESMR